MTSRPAVLSLGAVPKMPELVYPYPSLAMSLHSDYPKLDAGTSKRYSHVLDNCATGRPLHKSNQCA